MLITNENLERLRTGFRLDFTRGLGTASAKGAVLATPVNSSTRIETYGFLGDMPIMRKWIGEKRIKSIGEQAYQLVNDSFEMTIGIHKHKIQDDNLGLYPAMFSGWGNESAALPDRLIFDALAHGHERACFDGQNFFDTDHKVKDADVANMSGDNSKQPWFLVDLSKPLKPILLQTRQAPSFDMITDQKNDHVFRTGEYLCGAEARYGAGYTFWQTAYRCTSAITTATYHAARTAMAALTNDEGEPLGIRPTHIVVGSSNVAAARDLFLKQNLAGGESNVDFKDVEIIEADRLP